MTVREMEEYAAEINRRRVRRGWEPLSLMHIQRKLTEFYGEATVPYEEWRSRWRSPRWVPIGARR